MYKLVFFLLMFFITMSFAQQTAIQGKVVDSGQNPLIGVNVLLESSTIGTATNEKGEFSLSVSSLPAVLVFSYIGYKQQILTVSNTNYLEVSLKEAVFSSTNVMVIGSRFIPRTSITSPVPVDHIKIRELQETMQASFDKMLHYVVPSFNSTQQTISDATAHFDPADLRGLGPSRTLILINGKRKNPSALVFINDTPGKGDVGVDMQSIPVNAIKAVEVLRDGASAQYGSDAIAGVINVVLNDDYEETSINNYSSITHEGDGFQFGSNINTGFKIGSDGFINLSAGISDQKETNRAGEPGNDIFFGTIFKKPEVVSGTDPWVAKNPDLGMRVGLPNMTSTNAYFNSVVKLNDTGELYSYGGLVYRKGKSYALYRAPYWIPDNNFIHHKPGSTYQGFQPTFETSILDMEWTGGYISQRAGWNYDFSFTYGGNTVDYDVGNTLNLDLKGNSPTEFYVGGYEFHNNIVNFDVSRLLFDNFFISLGSELRQENFIAKAGDEASYFASDSPSPLGSGSQSFPGLKPENAINAKRNNIGTYLDVNLDVTRNLLIGAAARYEKYSDFGSSFTYKVSSRLKTSDNSLSIRGSISSGFRAPSLHQIYLSNTQTLVSGNTVSNQGTFNKNSSILRRLNVGELKEETATNFTIGIAGQPTKDIFFSADFFQIDLDDRIVYSSSIATKDTGSTVWNILQEENITSLKFFINGVNTQTRGIDLVSNYQVNKAKFHVAASFYKHSIKGKIKTPDILQANKIDIFDRKEQARLLSARPNTKIIAGATYNLKPFTIGLSSTYFGEVTWQHAKDINKDQTFSGKILSDLNFGYKANKNISLGLAINNIFSVYPDVIDTKGDPETNLGGRFKYPWEVNQFGFNGRTVLATANFSF